MYPAQGLADGVYTVNDLPDVLLVRLGDPPDTLVYKTGGTGPAYFEVNEETQQEVSIYLVQSFENPELAQWQINPGGLEISCLIDVFVEDQFAEAYTVSGPVSGTVTRESICTWTDENLRLTNFGYQWKVNGNNKSGFQNTPVGSYDGGYTVS